MSRFSEGERFILGILGFFVGAAGLVLGAFAIAALLEWCGVDARDAGFIGAIGVTFGPPIAVLLFIALRALIREGVKEVRLRLSTWHSRQKRLKDGPYR